MPKRLGPDEAVERMRAAGAEPLEPYPGVDEPWRCRCLSCGTIGAPRLSAVGPGRQGPCKPCGRLRANAKTRTDPAVAATVMRSAGFEPVEDYPGSVAPWRCRCLICRNDVVTTYSAVKNGARCRFCAATAPNPVLVRRAEAAVSEMRAAGLEPLVDYPGAKKPWRCRCLICGIIGTPRLGGIRAGQGGCRQCGQRKAAEAARSRMLDPESAASEMRAAGLEPLELYPGSDKRWLCECGGCGRQVHARLTGVRTGKGCRFCASHGIDLTGPAMLYLIKHEAWGALKIGIGACTGYNSRLLQHERTGWTLVRSREFVTGAAAQDAEQAVLDRLRHLGLAPYLNATTMPNGFTETCDAGRISTDELWAMVDNETDRTGAATASADGPRRRLSANGLIDPQAAVEQMRAAGFEPLVPYPGRSNTGWPSRCLVCGTEGRPRLNAVRNSGGGCRVCKNAAVRAAQVAAKSEEATAAMRAAGFEPLEPYGGTNKPWRCRCTHCGKESTPAHCNVRGGGATCRHCARARLRVGYAERAVAALSALGFEPLEPYPGSRGRWQCRCRACGSIHSLIYGEVQKGRARCRVCRP